MDGYPLGSLDHNVPLLVVSGLSSDHDQTAQPPEAKGKANGEGVLLRSDLPPLEGKQAKFLESYFEKVNERGQSWTVVTREEPYRVRVKTVGRSFVLPSRRATLPETIEPLTTAPVLHSPLSPLSPTSALYPDGLMNAQWIRKHQEEIPSIFVCFHTLTSDPNTATLQDNRLKADLNGIRATLVESGYKTRLVVIILGDQEARTTLTAEIIQDRLDFIRRGTGLDPKSIFYIPAQESPSELKRVMDSILTLLYNTAIEYYRDLGRHAKKKRSRGIVPQPTLPPTSGTSQTLSLPDWNFRYDFKSAVFAEFRQEIDAAIRSFEQAYEILLGQDVLDIIPSWSPRWNEARLLADIISIRCLRLHLWMGQTSLAVRRWQSHRDRISDFVDRRGRGTDNYGWQAWESRWAMVMANLIELVQVPGLGPSTMAIFLPPEKSLVGERLQPWELLHHTGYWYRIAARHLGARRALAHRIPDDDRGAPDASPASRVASKAIRYDTYLCPPPHEEYPLNGIGVNHSQLIIDCLLNARGQFQARKQHRIAAEISLECAREMATMKSWNEVLAMLRPLWEERAFRSEWWLDIAEDILWVMRRAAAETGRADIVIAIDWELMDKRYTRRRNWHYDLGKSLDGVSLTTKPFITISDDLASSFISASFAFRSKEGRAGETCLAQLSLKSDAHQVAAPITLASMRIEFEGHLKPITIVHDSSRTPADSSEVPTTVIAVSLTERSSGNAKESDGEEGENEDNDEHDAKDGAKTEGNEKDGCLTGTCDLTLEPGHRRVLEMNIPLREPGQASASRVILTYKADAFELDYTLSLSELGIVGAWFVRGSTKPRLSRPDGHVLQIQPRPPKMKLTLVEPLDQFYANEPIPLRISLLNGEHDSANVKLDIRILGATIPRFRVDAGEHKREVDAAEAESQVTGLTLGRIASSSSLEVSLRLDPAPAPTEYDIQVQADYHLDSDAATPITQVLSIHLNVVNAFEANYDLMPRLHPDAWPSLFDYEDVQDLTEGDVIPAKGLAQQWCLVCHYASFATEDLDVVGLDLLVTGVTPGGRCHVVNQPEFSADGMPVAPKKMYEARFDLVAQKNTLDDRHPVAIDLAFAVRWRRRPRQQPTDGEDSTVNVTTMTVGQYMVLGTEPRVLASVLHSSPEQAGLVRLDITIENPSSHFLTFGLVMEPSDTFAFSGPKQTTMHLLPMSRRTKTYRLLPLVRGAFIRPGLVVRDKYFQKVLRVIPTEGMKIDKDGLLVWVPLAPEGQVTAEG
ncbi:Gryzun, putative trafficking through Golgi domain-containing protein [Trichoderma novae-zelandiae]